MLSLNALSFQPLVPLHRLGRLLRLYHVKWVTKDAIRWRFTRMS
jgi:hypothetical protein